MPAENWGTYRDANRKLWEQWTSLRCTPGFQQVEAFLRGEDHLQDFEIEEVGDVAGKRLLHLQCHFGLDTMSWARRGAVATGVDFSPRAIETARSLATESSIEAEFVCSDVLELPDNLGGSFDIVYTSFGVLAWLSDLDRWARVVAHFLEPRGTFYIAEYHPITYVFDDQNETEPRVRHPYFPREEPIEFYIGGQVEYGWPYSMGTVVSALIGAGLQIEFLHEFDFSESQNLRFLRQGEDGRWRLPETQEGELPLLFSIRARGPARPTARGPLGGAEDRAS